MVRIKNALAQYFVGPKDSEATLELAKWISTVTNDADETTEETAYYDGDGTPETDVTNIKLSYSFEGTYDVADPAQKFIAGLEHEIGEGRKIHFRQVRTDGTVLEGPATVTGIKTTGGAASDFEPFNCTIAWDKKPTITPPAPVIPAG